jgi:DNA mismatch repair protein MutL
MAIRELPPNLVNRIAAGEVVERPASVVKELIENAIDAGASRIDILATAGGLGMICVTDDGAGMDASDLALSVERHATSKLADDDLSHILTLGFRGEALPSIGAVARLSILSRARGAAEAYEIAVDAGKKSALKPTALSGGTRVEVRDLFYATPARLKFMKSERAESAAIADMVKRLALAKPDIAFSLANGERTTLRLDPCPPGLIDHGLARLGRILGEDFAKDALPVRASRGEITLEGFAGLPTLHRPNASQLYLAVNGRPVRDKLLAGTVRAAYGDLLPQGRYPMLALFLTLPPDEVDVNVHPAKTELRFRDPNGVRSLLIGALRDALGKAGHRATASLSQAALERMTRPDVSIAPQPPSFTHRQGFYGREARSFGFAERAQAPLSPLAEPSADMRGMRTDDRQEAAYPLGAARAQVQDTFIIAETEDALVIVDQHAAHERIVYETLKRERDKGGIERQTLLTPLVVDLDPDAAALIDAHQGELAGLGLVVEGFGPGAVMVREAPSAIASGDLASLVRDLAADLAAEDGAQTLERRLDRWLGTFACRHSVRSGRQLKPEEMNALLREMERTPGAGQCNHGRPTYVELKLSDIERLFGRR